jgi:hypothetical protein
LGLTGTAALPPSIKGLPPIWFQGDVERIQPGKWMLVMSLNHQLPTVWEYAMVTGESAWHMQCDHHRDHWYEDFFGPLARVAAVAMGLTGDAVDFKSYASEHVVFTELCPYASASFGLDPEQVSHLVQSDEAFRTVAQIRGILLELVT